jgi:hypothetical protein
MLAQPDTGGCARALRILRGLHLRSLQAVIFCPFSPTESRPLQELDSQRRALALRYQRSRFFAHAETRNRETNFRGGKLNAQTPGIRSRSMRRHKTVPCWLM